jgi:hypothetical protein
MMAGLRHARTEGRMSGPDLSNLICPRVVVARHRGMGRETPDIGEIKDADSVKAAEVRQTLNLGG